MKRSINHNKTLGIDFIAGIIALAVAGGLFLVCNPSVKTMIMGFPVFTFVASIPGFRHVQREKKLLHPKYRNRVV